MSELGNKGIATRTIKRSGSIEPLDEKKIRNAIVRTGVDSKEAERILNEVRRELYDGIPTRKIYAIVRKHLNSTDRARFSLKKAIMDLGPEGFNFETLISRQFTRMGYDTWLRQRIAGRCIEHEVDIIVEKEGAREMIECKFHNREGFICHIDHALYTQARFNDLRETNDLTSVWLITNTRFSREAVKYANCVGMKLLGWRHPSDRGLEMVMKEANSYPITVLPLTRKIKNTLLEEDYLLTSDLLSRNERLAELLPLDYSRLMKAAERIESASQM